MRLHGSLLLLIMIQASAGGRLPKTNRNAPSSPDVRSRRAVPGGFCKGQPTGSKYAYPKEKCYYIYCLDGKPLKMKCQNGTRWHPQIKMCVNMHEHETCSQQNFMDDSSLDLRSRRAVSCRRKPKGYKFPNPTNQCQYYYCNGGNKRTIIDCGDEEKWNQDIGDCISMLEGEICYVPPETRYASARSASKPHPPTLLLSACLGLSLLISFMGRRDAPMTWLNDVINGNC